MYTSEESPSLYKVLGCSKDASSSELKRAYRKLALQLHPDKNPNDQNEAAARFQEVSRAYDVLGDPQKRQFYDNNGLTEELDVSAEDWMASFTEMVHDFTGGMPIQCRRRVQEMFSGLSKADLASMPPFPFPKELFPPGTFPAGVRFSKKSLDMLPPSVRELVETGQDGSLGLMFQTSTQQLQPEPSSLFSMLMGTKMPGSAPKSKRRGDRRGSRGKGYTSLPKTGLPAGINLGGLEDNLELLASFSDDELMQKLMKGELQLQDLGLFGMDDAFNSFNSEASSETSSQSGTSVLGEVRSENCDSDAADAVSDTDSVHSEECGIGGVEARKDRSSEGTQRTVLIQEVRVENASGTEDFSIEGKLDSGHTHVPMPHKSSRAQGGKGSASPSHAQNQSTGSPQQPPSAQLRAQWFRAAKCGHVPSLRAALEANQALLHLKGAGVGHTALHWAAAAGHISAVKWLLDTGSCPGTLNSVGSTPLHAAAAHGHTDVVRELLGRSRCDPHVVNDDGDTALQVAQRHSHAECVFLLRHRLAAEEPQCDTRSTPRSFVDDFPDALHNKLRHANQNDPVASQGHAPFASQVTPKDANAPAGATRAANSAQSHSASSREQDAQSSIHLKASHADSTSKCETITDLLSDVNWATLVTKEEGNSWMQAAKAGDVTTLQRLLKSNVTLVGYRGQGTRFGFGGNSALHWAVAKGHSDATRMLLKAGADPNCCNNGGRTALHSAVCNKKIGMIRILVVEGGADPQVKDMDGDTPRDSALSVFGADHDAVRTIDSCSITFRLCSYSRDNVRWPIRDMKALLATSGVPLVPGCEREDLEKLCRECLKHVSERLVPQDLVTEIKTMLENVKQGASQPSGNSPCANNGNDQGGNEGNAFGSSEGDSGCIPAHAAGAKEKGNAAFSIRDFRKAIVYYTMALRVTDPGLEGQGGASSALRCFRAALFSNRSAAHASTAMWQQALHDAEEALRIEDKSAKFWCRKGAAQLGSGKLQDAICTYKQALELDGSNAAAKEGLDIARRRVLDAV